MKLHEKIGVAIADAGYDWTPEMRSAWEELDRQTKPLSNKEIEKIYKKVYEEGHNNQVVALGRAIEERHGIK